MIQCLVQGHNTVPPVTLNPVTVCSQVDYSTTELLRFTEMKYEIRGPYMTRTVCGK